MNSTTPAPSPTTGEAFFNNLGGGIRDAWNSLATSLKGTLGDAAQNVIVTQDQSGNVLFKTTVSLDGSVKNEFPATKPQTEDVYWTRHNALVDQAIQNRIQIVLKMMDTVGQVVKLPV
jgi:hypothetical protein